ncbi:MAG: DNA alkylation repair protein [Candidatus Altiarchaeales archaeon]|nr:DNA alkylation repair protein [Candidatus Altiarchaeales archaeon]
MHSADGVIRELKSKARRDQLEGMAKFGMTSKGRLGVSVPDMRALAKKIGKNHNLALELWDTKIQEARMLASMIDEPEKVSERQLEEWVKDFDSWDVCDQTCMNLFEKTPYAWKKILEWSKREEEFVKRTAFAWIACLAWHDKKMEDKKFVEMLKVIEKASTDERNFVKKAVNWALRNIGKRNRNLNKEALKTARRIQKTDSKAARWIAADAIRELESPQTQKRLKG